MRQRPASHRSCFSTLHTNITINVLLRHTRIEDGYRGRRGSNDIRVLMGLNLLYLCMTGFVWLGAIRSNGSGYA